MIFDTLIILGLSTILMGSISLLIFLIINSIFEGRSLKSIVPITKKYKRRFEDYCKSLVGRTLIIDDKEFTIISVHLRYYPKAYVYTTRTHNRYALSTYNYVYTFKEYLNKKYPNIKKKEVIILTPTKGKTR